MSYSFGRKKTTIEESVLDTLRLCFDMGDADKTRSHISQLMTLHGEDKGSFTNIFLREVLVVALHGVDHTGSEDGNEYSAYHHPGHYLHHHQHTHKNKLYASHSLSNQSSPSLQQEKHVLTKPSLLGTVALPSLNKLTQEYPPYRTHATGDQDLSSNNDESSHARHSGYEYESYDEESHGEFVAGSGSDIPSHSSDNEDDEENKNSNDNLDGAEDEIFEDEANLIPGEVGHATPLIPPSSSDNDDSLALLCDDIFIAVAQFVAAETQRVDENKSTTNRNTITNSNDNTTNNDNNSTNNTNNNTNSDNHEVFFTSEAAFRLAEDITRHVLHTPETQQQFVSLQLQHLLNNGPLHLRNRPLNAAFISMAAAELQQIVKPSVKNVDDNNIVNVKNNNNNNDDVLQFNDSETENDNDDTEYVYDDSGYSEKSEMADESQQNTQGDDDENMSENDDFHDHKQHWLLIPAQEDVRRFASPLSAEKRQGQTNIVAKASDKLSNVDNNNYNINAAYKVAEYDSDLEPPMSRVVTPLKDTANGSSVSQSVKTPVTVGTQQITQEGECVAAWDLPRSPMEHLFRKGYGGLGQSQLKDVIDLLENEHEKHENETVSDAEEDEEEDEKMQHSNGSDNGVEKQEVLSDGFGFDDDADIVRLEDLPTVPIPVSQKHYYYPNNTNDKDDNLSESEDESDDDSAFDLSPVTPKNDETFSDDRFTFHDLATMVPHEKDKEGKQGGVPRGGLKYLATQSHDKLSPLDKKQKTLDISLNLLSPPRTQTKVKPSTNSSAAQQQQKKPQPIVRKPSSGIKPTQSNTTPNNNITAKGKSKMAGTKKLSVLTASTAISTIANVPTSLLKAKPTKPLHSENIAPKCNAHNRKSLSSSPVSPLQQLISSQLQQKHQEKELSSSLKKKKKTTKKKTPTDNNNHNTDNNTNIFVNYANTTTNNDNNENIVRSIDNDLENDDISLIRNMQALRASLGELNHMQKKMTDKAQDTLQSSVSQPPVSQYLQQQNQDTEGIPYPGHSDEILLHDDLLPPGTYGDTSVEKTLLSPALPLPGVSQSLNAMILSSFRSHLQQYSNNSITNSNVNTNNNNDNNTFNIVKDEKMVSIRTMDRPQPVYDTCEDATHSSSIDSDVYRTLTVNRNPYINNKANNNNFAVNNTNNINNNDKAQGKKKEKNHVEQTKKLTAPAVRRSVTPIHNHNSNSSNNNGSMAKKSISSSAEQQGKLPVGAPPRTTALLTVSIPSVTAKHHHNMDNTITNNITTNSNSSNTNSDAKYSIHINNVPSITSKARATSTGRLMRPTVASLHHSVQNSSDNKNEVKHANHLNRRLSFGK